MSAEAETYGPPYEANMFKSKHKPDGKLLLLKLIGVDLATDDVSAVHALLVQLGIAGAACHGEYEHEDPLRMAVRRGFTNIARLMLSMGAPVNGYNSYAETALQVAMEEDRLSMVKMLCAEFDADYTITNNTEGNAYITALHKLKEFNPASARLYMEIPPGLKAAQFLIMWPYLRHYSGIAWLILLGRGTNFTPHLPETVIDNITFEMLSSSNDPDDLDTFFDLWEDELTDRIIPSFDFRGNENQDEYGAHLEENAEDEGTYVD